MNFIKVSIIYFSLSLCTLFAIENNSNPFSGLAVGVQYNQLDEFTDSKGVVFAYPINSHWRSRVTLNKFDYKNNTNVTGSFSGTSFSLMQISQTMNQRSISLLGDYFYLPSKGLFLTGGIIKQYGDMNFTAQPNTALTGYSIGNNTYSGTDLGTLTGKVKNKSLVPYLGLGWTTKSQTNKKAGWFAEASAGKVFNLNPSVTLNSTNANSTAGLASDLIIEAETQRKSYPNEQWIMGLIIGYQF